MRLPWVREVTQSVQLVSMCWARVPKLVLVMLHPEPRAHTLPHERKLKRFSSHLAGSFIFFLKSYFYITKLSSSQEERVITMEKTQHNGTRGEVHLSVINTFLKPFPNQEWLILPRKGGFPVFPPLIIIKFLVCRRFIPTAACALLSRVSFLTGHFEMLLMWGPGSIPDSSVTQKQGGPAGREVLVLLYIIVTSFPALPTPRPMALCFVGALPVSRPQGPF